MMMLRLTWHQFYRHRHVEEDDKTFKSDSAPFSIMHVAQMALHRMQYWWLHRWKWCPHAIAPEFAPMCAPEKARKHQKSDWCRFICGTDVSTRCVIIVMEGDSCSSCWCRGLCLWCIKLTIWPLTSSPASNRSVPPPFSPESVFTNGAMHASDLHMGGAFLFSQRSLIGQWAK